MAWSKTTKPTVSWSSGAKPAVSWGKDIKPTANWGKDTKPTVSWSGTVKPTVSFFLLLETGDRLLQEDSSSIVLTIVQSNWAKEVKP